MEQFREYTKTITILNTRNKGNINLYYLIYETIMNVVGPGVT